MAAVATRPVAGLRDSRVRSTTRMPRSYGEQVRLGGHQCLEILADDRGHRLVIASTQRGQLFYGRRDIQRSSVATTDLDEGAVGLRQQAIGREVDNDALPSLVLKHP
jgi:hypothetical protein